jgi:hypothetical protein
LAAGIVRHAGDQHRVAACRDGGGKGGGKGTFYFVGKVECPLFPSFVCPDSCPGGAIEGSPALQCWDRSPPQAPGSPVGTAETRRTNFGRPYGTNDAHGRSPDPAMNRWATIKRPHGTQALETSRPLNLSHVGALFPPPWAPSHRSCRQPGCRLGDDPMLAGRPARTRPCGAYRPHSGGPALPM